MQASRNLRSAYLEDAAWMPFAYDARADRLCFAHLPRDVQRRATLLDPRYLQGVPTSPWVSPAHLNESALSQAAGPLYFIFHTAFCCSTLLTRALDVPGVSMGLKEPAVLVSFAEHWASGRRTPGALPALRITLDLLSRPLGPGETQIVKPSSICNHLIPDVLTLRPDAKALLLYSSLESFLRAVARRGILGRAFARNTYQQYAGTIPLDHGFSAEALFQQTDLQIAAQTWLAQVAFLQSLAERLGPKRVRILDAATLVEKPADTLLRTVSFFGLNLDAAECAAIAQGSVFREHAKNPSQHFDASAHQLQFERSGAAHRDEIEPVRAWAYELAARCGAPIKLQETLAI